MIYVKQFSFLAGNQHQWIAHTIFDTIDHQTRL
jgi:hypothetical protein